MTQGIRTEELSAGQLLRRIHDRGAELLEAQVAMARAELVRDFDARVRALAQLALGLFAVSCGLNLLLVAVVLAVGPTLSGWVASSLLSVPFLVGGTILLRTARSTLSEIPMRETSRALETDWRWLRSLTR